MFSDQISSLIRFLPKSRGRSAAWAAGFLLATALHVGATAVERYGQLSVKGNRIVDKDGNPVILRGMSLYWSQWKGRFYNPSAVKWLAQDWKCTVLRASMAVENGGYLTNPDAEKKKVMTVVQAAIDLGIYVIIDWHEENAGKHIAQSQQFFEEMARTYGRYPNVIYELYNEPLNTYPWSQVIKPYHEAIIPIIRAQDPDNIIVCGTRSWSQDVDEASKDPVAGTNIAYTLHFYAGTHKQSLRDKAAVAMKNGIALFVTEWGTGEANGSGVLDAAETRKWWDFMDQNRLSSCNWSIADLTETTAALRPGASATGGWGPADLSASGSLVREELRLKNLDPAIALVSGPQGSSPDGSASAGREGKANAILRSDLNGRLRLAAPKDGPHFRKEYPHAIP